MSKLAEINLKVKPIDFKQFNDLMCVLTDSPDKLPTDLRGKVIEIVKAGDYSLIDVDYILANGFKLPAIGYAAGVEMGSILSVNKVLKHVKSVDAETDTVINTNPCDFKLIDANGLVVVEW